MKQFQVIIKPERLTSFHVTLQQVFEALEKTTRTRAATSLSINPSSYVVRGLGLVKGTGVQARCDS